MQFGREEKVPGAKLTAVQYAILGVFLILLFGFWRLQISGSEQYETLAEANRVRTIPILAPRGKIVDREGRLIVDNYPSFSALLVRENAKDLDAKLPRIARGLNLNEADIRRDLRRMAGRPRYEPLIVKPDITPDEVAFIEANRSEIPELETIMVHRRLYPRDGFAAHLIGYVGEVSEDDLNRPQFELYNQGDIVGKSGVEYQYNDMLMGKDGERRAEVDSKGREVKLLGERKSQPGQKLRLTIDLDLQIAAEEALEGHNGAIVAMDPRTGEILALVSRPTYDPNHFAVRVSREEWNRLITDPAKPMMNKAIQAQLAPGSVFKIIMSVAGMQEGIAQDMVVNCGGGKNFYGRFFKCWIAAQRSSHGTVALEKAIYQSCDTFFYTLGERLGIGRIAQYSQAFGLGQRTEIDLPQEQSGVMPSEEWKIRNFKQKWYVGETISVSIGQGAVATTPIQLARAIGAIAMGGKVVRPHVAHPADLPQQYQQVAAKFSETSQVTMSQDAWVRITDALGQVVVPGGTAAASRLEGVDWGGKTGTAQVISNEGLKKAGGGHHFKDNGWFSGVHPRRNPEIVVTTLIEQGEHGSLAARVTSEVIKAYAAKKKRSGVQTAGISRDGKVEISAVWTRPDEHFSAHSPNDGGTPRTQQALSAGRFYVPLKAAKKVATPAIAITAAGATQ